MRHLYSFRTRELARSNQLTPTPNASMPFGCEITDQWEIVARKSDSRLMRYFVHDLADFFSDAFSLDLKVRRVEHLDEALLNSDKCILLLTREDAPCHGLTSQMEGAFHITVTEKCITVVGASLRGTAQGVYYLEEQMKLRGESRLPLECAQHAPLFSPRLTHSGMELDTFTDEYLAACAHAGMDAIMVFTGSPDTNHHGFPDPDALWPGSGRGYCDFNQLVWRAAGYGLDVYAYSHFKCDMHPRDAGAREYYEKSFGTLFRQCPGLKGIIFVGECFEFPSLDEHTTGVRIQLKDKADPRPSPGWYPCFDYPELVTLVRDVIRRYNPCADLVFWTYNWGYVEEEARLKLIRALPTDISLLVTFDMFEIFTDEKGRQYRIDDYSISFPGPGQYYVSEAEEAKKRGIRLYTMANTGGRTWDNGVTPYLPVPQQWQKRFAALRESHARHGLCGLMENHHYGWFPSFLTPFARNAFDSAGLGDEEMLASIARRDWGACADHALRAWQKFSDGIRGIVAADCDQYGPYRCGPTYPLLFDQKKEELHLPSVPWAAHGGFGIIFPIYPDNVFEKTDFTLLRYERVLRAERNFREGVQLLTEAADACGAEQDSEMRSQCAVAGFLHATYVTAKHVMQWAILKALLRAAREGVRHSREDELYACVGSIGKNVGAIAAKMEEIARLETENVNRAVAFHEADSRIGYEPTMDYVFSAAHAAWKNAETQRSLERLKKYLAQ
ncbi:MAG: hypothetical protein E7326_05500 [Clostridiales bacterium]|nr:hypothetical protein [Clostridiales bacterium]